MQMRVGVRQGRVGDEAELRDLRLRALADAPQAFSATYAANAARTTAQWGQWLATVATFFAETDEGEAVGLAGMARPEHEPEGRELVSMWVDPRVRGKGVGDALVQAVLTTARAEGASTCRVRTYESNDEARHLYERHGFRRTGRSQPPDESGRRPIELEQRLRTVEPSPDAIGPSKAL